MLDAIFFSFLILAQGDALRGQLNTIAAVALLSSEDPAAEKTAEDVEIMRRLLVQAIDETAPHAAEPEPGKVRFLGGFETQPITGPLTSFYSVSSSGVVTHSRAFYLPGSGAIFVVDARVPAVAVEERAEGEEDEVRADDDWERVRREVRTGKTEVAGGVFKVQLRGAPKAWELDPDAIEDIERAVLETLGRHGGRIALEDGEDILVALHLQQGSSSSGTGLLGYTLSLGDDDGDQGETGWATLAGRIAPPQRVILRVRAGDVVRAGKDVRELRERAVVFRY